MTPGSFTVNSRADLSRLIAYCSLHCQHRVPLYEAVYHGAIATAEVTRDAALPVKMLERCPRPTLVLIGDDDGLDTGPDGWVCRPRLASWARHAVVHATGGDVASYRAAVLLAVERRRLVLVETGTANVAAWHNLFAKAGVPTLNLIPADGGVHPVPVQAGAMH